MSASSQLIQIELGPKIPSPKPSWLKARAPVGDNFHNSEEAGSRAWVAYGLRVGAMPQYWRVLGPPHCDVHAAWRYLHPALRILRGAEGVLRRLIGMSHGAWPKLSLRWACSHAVVTSVNRDDDNVGGAKIFAETIRQIREVAAGVPGRGADPGFSGTGRAAPASCSMPSRTCSITIRKRCRASTAPCARALAINERSICWRMPRSGIRRPLPRAGVMVGIGEEHRRTD